MSIYRGAGGAGDAVADSSSEALLVRELAAEVQADADAAAASATAASTSASNASTSATNASNSATAAATSATNASNSASSASTSASNAATSATAAQTAETNAETAETNAAASATAAANSATSAASSASTATTQATNASNSASAAATSATNASNSASAASTSATNAASSATAAAGSATSASSSASSASTSASNAATSATNAASSATTATTQAGIATTQATNASNSASAASTSATSAASSATAAAGSATTASTQATNAANSASAAATSETNAAASAAAAAASYDSFDDRYLGSKSAAPALDNDGNALVVGALYYNNGTVTPADKGMYVYDGSLWIAASAASTAILTVFKYTATAGQTTFTGADDNALTLTYTAGSAIITVNGAVMEVGTDVTASNGTSIVLAQAALVGDEVNIYAFATFNIANTYTKAQTDATFLPKVSPSISSGNLTFATTGQRITGDFTNATIASRALFQTSTANTSTIVGLIPNGTGTVSRFTAYNTSSPDNASEVSVGVTSAEMQIQSAIRGTGTYLPMTLYTGGAERMRLDTSGNVGIGTSSLSGKLSVLAQASTTYGNFDATTAGFGFITFKEAGTTLGYIGPSAIGSGGKMAIASESTNPLVFATNATERMRIDSSGNLLVNTTTATGASKFVVAADTTTANPMTVSNTRTTAATDYQIIMYRAGNIVGSIQTSLSATSYVTSSDYRLKDNIAPMTGALEKVAQLNPVTYKWKLDGSDGQGFIAHELQAVVPDCVTGEKDAVDADGNPVYQGIDTSFLVATLTAAIQELKAQLDESNLILTSVKTELDATKAEVAALKGTA